MWGESEIKSRYRYCYGVPISSPRILSYTSCTCTFEVDSGLGLGLEMAIYSTKAAAIPTAASRSAALVATGIAPPELLLLLDAPPLPLPPSVASRVVLLTVVVLVLPSAPVVVDATASVVELRLSDDELSDPEDEESRIVVLPTVVSMVLPSEVMVETIGSVVTGFPEPVAPAAPVTDAPSDDSVTVVEALSDDSVTVVEAMPDEAAPEAELAALWKTPTPEPVAEPDVEDPWAVSRFGQSCRGQRCRKDRMVDVPDMQ